MKLIPRIRVTRGHVADYRFTSSAGEMSLSLTGHCEERDGELTADGVQFTVHPVRPFRFTPRSYGETHRVAGRKGGRPVVELIWAAD